MTGAKLLVYITLLSQEGLLADSTKAGTALAQFSTIYVLIYPIVFFYAYSKKIHLYEGGQR